MIEFAVKAGLPVNASRVFNDWLSSEGHTNMTGGSAEISPIVGSEHSAWDGYIWGEIIEIDKDNRILMSWKTSDFAEDSKHSMVEVIFKDLGDSCELIINHSEIPENQDSDYQIGWVEHYFKPMLQYYLP